MNHARGTYNFFLGTSKLEEVKMPPPEHRVEVKDKRGNRFASCGRPYVGYVCSSGGQRAGGLTTHERKKANAQHSKEAEKLQQPQAPGTRKRKAAESEEHLAELQAKLLDAESRAKEASSTHNTLQVCHPSCLHVSYTINSMGTRTIDSLA